MAEGRPLHGKDFVDNMQDYVEERMTYGTDSDEYEELNRELTQDERDLEALERGGARSQPNMDAIAEEAALPTRQDRAHGASAIEAGGDGEVNYQHLAPEDEARNNVARQVTDRGDQGKIGR